jgi:two-component sensor histidine kinase
MCPSGNDQDPIVEPSPGGDAPDLTMRALRQRIRQQEILAELGVSALQGAPFEQLLGDTARLTAEGLDTEFCKVLEHIPAENRLLVRAGIGWGPGVVGVASVGADLASPAGYALRTGKPVISNHLEHEDRFRTPEMLQNFAIRRAMNVILQGDGKPYGVLEVDSRSEAEFDERDIAFLQGAANILGMAIERDRQERNLRAALQRHEALLTEMGHRVKNSLAIVASMLQLQANEVGNESLALQLEEASNRIAAVARAHDRLQHGEEIERRDVGRYIEAVCIDLAHSVAPCRVETAAQHGIVIATDRAIAAALIVNELVANATKYAYQGRPGQTIRVSVERAGDDACAIVVRDEGEGLPEGFDQNEAGGLGMRIVRSFLAQVNGTLTVRTCSPGAEFTVLIPL